MGAELKRSSAVRSALKEAGKQHHWLFSERCGDISAQNTPGCESKGCHFMSIHSLSEGKKETLENTENSLPEFSTGDERIFHECCFGA